MQKLRVGTVWLDGCSGCHMSFLDMDEKLIELSSYMDVVYSPYVDSKDIVENIDIFIVEGAIASEHDLELIKKIRKNSKTIIALGDCAVTGNISAMKNLHGTSAIMQRGYIELADINTTQEYPSKIVPKLLDKVIPLSEAVDIDYFIPGCPTPSNAIYNILKAIIDKKDIKISDYTRFGV